MLCLQQRLVSVMTTASASSWSLKHAKLACADQRSAAIVARINNRAATSGLSNEASMAAAKSESEASYVTRAHRHDLHLTAELTPRSNKSSQFQCFFPSYMFCHSDITCRQMSSQRLSSQLAARGDTRRHNDSALDAAAIASASIVQ